MRRRALAASAALLLVVVAGGCSGSHQPDAGAQCPYPSPPSWGQAPVGIAAADGQSITAPPGGTGALRVIETGFRQIKDGSRVTIGAVVENGTGQVAYRTRVIFRATGKAGGGAIDQDETWGHLFEIPIMRPGERAVIGDFAGVDDTLFLANGRYPPVAAARLDLMRTQWMPAEATGSYPRITVEARPPASASGDDSVSIPVRTISDACHSLMYRGASLVFRDSSGKIVGGTFDRDSESGLCETPTADGQASAFPSVPAGADLARTEASVFCDVSGTATGAVGPDHPVN